jgi:hypothetical protein
LKSDGIYFGSENNASVFRNLFDILQKISPIWSEEAGPEALISRKYLLNSFSGHECQNRNPHQRLFTTPPDELGH